MFRDDASRHSSRKLWPTALDSTAVHEAFRHPDGPTSPKSAPTTPRRDLLPQEITHVVFDDFGATPVPRESPLSPKTARRNQSSVGNPITGEPSSAAPVSPTATASPTKATGRKKTELSGNTWASHIPFASNPNDDPIPKAKPRGLKVTPYSSRNYSGDSRPQYDNPHHYTTTKNLSPRSPQTGVAPFETNGKPRTPRTPQSPHHADHIYDVMRDPEASPSSKSAPTTPRRGRLPQEVTHVIFDDFNKPSPESRPTSRGRANVSTFNPFTASPVGDSPVQADRTPGRGKTPQSQNAFTSTWKY